MILGEYARETNLPVNVCREKSSPTSAPPDTTRPCGCSPPRLMTLDTALERIDEEELVELTPRSVRLRNRVLKTGLRGKHRAGWMESAGAGAAQAAESE